MAESIVDNSRLAAVASCTTKTLIEFVHGFQTIEEAATLKQGSAGHKALATYFRGGSIEQVMEVYRQEYADWAQVNVLPDDRLSFENTKAVLGEYLRTHPPERFPFVPIVGGIEKAVKAELAPGITFYGLVDLPARSRETGALVIVDHKFSGGVNSYWAKQFRLGSQLTGYMWAAEQAFGEVVPEAYVNAIEVSRLPESDRKCRTHGVPYFECRAKHAKWELFVTTRSARMVADWKQEAIALAKQFERIGQIFGSDLEMIQYAPQEGKFNGHCRNCQFLEFCLMGRGKQLVETMLRYSPWEPWKENGR